MIKTRIRDLREDNDYNQKYVAEYIGVKQNTYSDYENEKLNLSIETLIELAQLYNTSIDYIVYLTDTNKPYGREK